MASDGRGERRRRILERGSDRLALITGQSKALDPSLSSPSSASPSPSVNNISDDRHQINAAPEAADGTSVSELLKDKASNAFSEANNSGFLSQTDLNLLTTTATVGSSGSNNLTREQQPGSTPSAQKSSHRHFFSSKQINSCIIASERTRAICSLMIASLVVISYVDYPLFGINIVRSESIIAYRPLYMLLLTDVTIVLIRIFRKKISGAEEVEEAIPPMHTNEGHNWEGAVKLMERGLVVYQAIRGIFIDCSVYLVVVICFLSLV